MEIIKEKLNRIADFWEHYLWKAPTLQKKIRFDKEIKTNYFGDICGYFTDTFDLLKIPSNYNKDFQTKLFFTIGILQIIYVQQDLIDELLHIFRLNYSTIADKDPNRTLRNELVGHPISRDINQNQKLKSSVLFSRDLSNNLFNYAQYDINNDFKFQLKTFDINVVIERHKEFLNKYLDLIWNKDKHILKDYKKRLTDFEKAIKSGIRLEKIINLCEQLFERIFRENRLHTKNYLLECELRQNEHYRYKNAVNLFMAELKSSIKDTKKSIDNLLNTKFSKKTNTSEQKVKDNFTFVDSSKINENTGKNDYHYEIGKLYDRSPVFGISYFRKSFKGKDKINQELDNMEKNYNSDLEYYCSLELLKHLINNQISSTTNNS